MKTYAKKALKAHEATNCLTDVMFQESLIAPTITGWGPGIYLTDGSTASDVAREGLLLGVPVSIKGAVLYPTLSTMGRKKLTCLPRRQTQLILKATIPLLATHRTSENL